MTDWIAYLITSGMLFILGLVFTITGVLFNRFHRITVKTISRVLFLLEILFLVSHSTSDGVHLTQKGHDAFARNLTALFQKQTYRRNTRNLKEYTSDFTSIGGES